MPGPTAMVCRRSSSCCRGSRGRLLTCANIVGSGRASLRSQRSDNLQRKSLGQLD